MGVGGGDVEGVVGADRMAIRPSQGCKRTVRHTVYRPMTENIYDHLRPCLRKASSQHRLPQDRQHLGVHQLRRGQ